MNMRFRLNFAGTRASTHTPSNAVVPLDKVHDTMPNDDSPMVEGSMEINIFANPMDILEFAEIEINLNVLGRLVD